MTPKRKREDTPRPSSTSTSDPGLGIGSSSSFLDNWFGPWISPHDRYREASRDFKTAFQTVTETETGSMVRKKKRTRAWDPTEDSLTGLNTARNATAAEEAYLARGNRSKTFFARIRAAPASAPMNTGTIRNFDEEDFFNEFDDDMSQLRCCCVWSRSSAPLETINDADMATGNPVKTEHVDGVSSVCSIGNGNGEEQSDSEVDLDTSMSIHDDNDDPEPRVWATKRPYPYPYPYGAGPIDDADEDPENESENGSHATSVCDITDEDGSDCESESENEEDDEKEDEDEPKRTWAAKKPRCPAMIAQSEDEEDDGEDKDEAITGINVDLFRLLRAIDSKMSRIIADTRSLRREVRGARRM